MRLVILGFVLSCASSPVKRPLCEPHALPRSSIAAVILHRAELGLSDDQVRQMQQIDEQRAQADAKLQEVPAPKRDPQRQRQVAPGGMGGRGGRRGMGMGRLPRASASSGDGADRAERVEQRMDDNDTNAFLAAEEALTDEQRDKARDIAEDYREALYDWREKQKQCRKP